MLSPAKTSNGQRIHCLAGDITKLHVDAIISSTDANIGNHLGVAKAVSLAAGKEMQAECNQIVKAKGMLKSGGSAITKAYKLPCKIVVHVLSPRSRQELVKAFGGALTKVHKQNLQSVAVPAIGAGEACL